MKEQLKLNIDLKNTRPVTLDENHVFTEGVVLRKVSKFITGTNEDNVLPIQVFYDPETGEILKDGLPDEFKFILEDDQN